MTTKRWVEQLRRARAWAGHTHVEAAEEIGVSGATINVWLMGKRLQPTRGNEAAVAKYISRHLGEEVQWPKS